MTGMCAASPPWVFHSRGHVKGCSRQVLQLLQEAGQGAGIFGGGRVLTIRCGVAWRDKGTDDGRACSWNKSRALPLAAPLWVCVCVCVRTRVTAMGSSKAQAWHHIELLLKEGSLSCSVECLWVSRKPGQEFGVISHPRCLLLLGPSAETMSSSLSHSTPHNLPSVPRPTLLSAPPLPSPFVVSAELVNGIQWDSRSVLTHGSYVDTKAEDTVQCGTGSLGKRCLSPPHK